MSESEPRTTAGTTPGPEWVSAVEAAKVARVTPATIRAWARDGLIASQSSQGPFGPQKMFRMEEILARVEPGERRRADRRRKPAVPVPTERRAAQRRAKASSKPTKDSESPGRAPATAPSPEPEPPRQYDPGIYLEPLIKTIPDLMAHLTEATDRAARAEVKVEFLTQQLGEVKARLERTNPPDAPAGPFGESTAETHVESGRAVIRDADDTTNAPVARSTRDLTEDIWGAPADARQAVDPSPIGEQGAPPDGWRWPDEPEKTKRRLFGRRRGRHNR